MAQDQRAIEEANTLQRSQLLGLRYLDTRTLQQKPLYPDLLGKQEMYDQRVIPIVSSEDGITFGITTNTSPKIRDSLRTKFNDRRVQFVLISDVSYKEYMLLYDPPEKVVYSDIELNDASSEHGIEHISETLDKVKADDMLAYIVKQAFRLKASDIHLENADDDVGIRLRVHGVLHPIARLSKERYRMLTGALASAANVSTSSADPQTGQINRSFQLEDSSEIEVNLRVETVPTVHGMDAVLRLFNFDPDMLHLDKLGLSDYQQGIIGDIVQHPSGLVLIVGPTGSGKSTTLYSIINELRSPTNKIITLEDPVEYQVEGITQIPVNTQEGSSFDENLRAVLRLDPDTIMIGEIRDTETARTALQAALTGHLVLSTYHASSASAAMTRILDATDENPLFISAIRLVQAQRLIRKLDDSTKQPYQPDNMLRQQIIDVVDSLPEYVQRPDLSNITLYSPGASEENPFGFSGQVAIRELMVMTSELKELLQQKGKKVSSDRIDEVVKSSMTTMLQDGILRALAGETTIEEIYRVVR